MKQSPQQNYYIYTGSKPERNLGDLSLENDSFNNIEEDKENENENYNDIIITENYFEIPKESEIPPIHIPFNNIELFKQNKQGLFFCSATKDTENGCLRLNTNNKEENFNIKKNLKFGKENNRYNINNLYINNCRFFNSLQDDNESEDEDIVNNELTVNYADGLDDNENCQNKKEKQVEISLEPNISKRYSNSEISNNKIDKYNSNNKNINNDFNNDNYNNINVDKINEIQNENLIKKIKLDENIKKIIENINKNKKEWKSRNPKINYNNINKENKDNNEDYFIENKENIVMNCQYDREVNFSFNPIKDNMSINKIKNEKNINKINNNRNEIKINLNNKFFELKNSQRSIDISNSKSKSKSKSKCTSSKKKNFKPIFNLTKQYKIFEKFLCVSIDTTGLYTLDDTMNSFILNPKITYNYPFNNLEKELE